MEKEILLTIQGLQMMDDDTDSTTTITPGTYYLKNGKHYLLYEEVAEGFEQTTQNRIKISEGYMEVFKKGVTNVHMVFEKDKKNVTYYYTPYGSLLIGIDATRVDVTEEADTLTAEVEYALEINNEFVANCHISINATSNRELTLVE